MRLRLSRKGWLICGPLLVLLAVVFFGGPSWGWPWWLAQLIAVAVIAAAMLVVRRYRIRDG